MPRLRVSNHAHRLEQRRPVIECVIHHEIVQLSRKQESNIKLIMKKETKDYSIKKTYAQKFMQHGYLQHIFRDKRDVRDPLHTL